MSVSSFFVSAPRPSNLQGPFEGALATVERRRPLKSVCGARYHVSHSPNSRRGVKGFYRGLLYGVIKGDTRSFDYNSFGVPFVVPMIRTMVFGVHARVPLLGEDLPDMSPNMLSSPLDYGVLFGA